MIDLTGGHEAHALIVNYKFQRSSGRIFGMTKYPCLGAAWNLRMEAARPVVGDRERYARFNMTMMIELFISNVR